MSTLVPALLDGLLAGGVYALLALGFTIVHLVLGLVNLAQGGLLVLAMAAAWFLAARFDIDPYASLPLLTLLMFGLGWALHRFAIGPAGTGAGTLVLLGLGLALDRLAVLLLPGPPRGFASSYAATTMSLGTYPVAVTRLAGFGIAAVLAALLFLFATQTDTGRSIRAVAVQPDGARVVGLRPGAVRALAFGVATACLGAAACLLLPAVPLAAGSGPAYLLVSATGALLGGLGSLGGALLGGLLVGVLEALMGWALGRDAAMAALALLLAAMAARRAWGMRDA